jgi:hypothetical protein
MNKFNLDKDKSEKIQIMNLVYTYESFIFMIY